MKKVRSLLKAWAFRFFIWRIEVKLSRLDGHERIIHLANLLMDECERQGYDTEFHHPTSTGLRTVDVSYYAYHEADNFVVGYISNGWQVRGDRTA